MAGAAAATGCVLVLLFVVGRFAVADDACWLASGQADETLPRRRNGM